MQRKCIYIKTFQVRYSKHNAVFDYIMLNNQRRRHIQEKVKVKVSFYVVHLIKLSVLQNTSQRLLNW